MACKQGIRKNIEDSRAYYQSLKAYDPFRALWISLVEKSSNNSNLAGWTQDEICYFCVRLLEGEVYNGGFEQYFSNSSGDYYKYSLLGLETLGAVNSKNLLQKAAAAMFEGAVPPESQMDRWRNMERESDSDDDSQTTPEWSSTLDKLDAQFWADPDRLGDLLCHFAESRGLVSPFTK